MKAILLLTLFLVSFYIAVSASRLHVLMKEDPSIRNSIALGEMEMKYDGGIEAKGGKKLLEEERKLANVEAFYKDYTPVHTHPPGNPPSRT